ncbi:glycoside hydrolase domain-containing protein [Chitinophaga sp. MM2321]|uniref:glycoside hydrolase domain-containing protein n=1 Tax=Chitinophaga sp. MM2321 TaxID=3137178 RepID=UPI0032D5AAD1
MFFANCYKQVCCTILIWLFYTTAQAAGVPYSVAAKPWDESLGNHRAEIQVLKATGAAYVKIPWRRRGMDPALMGIIITDEKGTVMKNIFRVNMNLEAGELVFEPTTGAGKYYVYYMPYKGKKNNGSFQGDYLKPEDQPDTQWVTREQLSLPYRAVKEKAEVLQIQSRTAFDSFYPMEVCATGAEIQQLIRRSTHDFILFPEDRKYPVRMDHELPYRWITRQGPPSFSATANRNEYYAFQVGVYAAKTDLEDVTVSYSRFSDRLTCFNLEGVDADGKKFTRKVNVAKGKVQALWFGLDIPENPQQKEYTFTITIKPRNGKAQVVPVKIKLTDTLQADRGDNEPWRHSRLRWLNSTLGEEEEVIAPYTALQRQGNSITTMMHLVQLDNNGLLAAVNTNAGKNILQRPLRLIIETSNGIAQLTPGKIIYTKEKDAVISWEAQATNEALSLTCKGNLEFDGHLTYHTTVKATKNIVVKDVRLEIAVDKQTARYFMGMGLPGQSLPASYNWKWKGPQDSYWIGNYDAGIHCEFLGATYSGPLLNLYHPAPPPSWYNDNKGGFKLAASAEGAVATTYSGERTLQQGQQLNFDFALLLTPVKKQNVADQFTTRYYHNGSKPAPALSDLSSGIKVTNVHHGNGVNPYINYPFVAVDTMRKFVDYWHRQGLKVKIYYTIRELSNQAAEIWALRSLGEEVLADGKGGGYPWLREHLVDHYNVQWFTDIKGYERADAAILTSGKSRWYNYYVEGLKWLVKNEDIDGLYLDDVSFDRSMLKRMRRVMDAIKPGCLLDLHSNTGFSKGPANQYTEYFPFINKIWFGESFDYNNMSPENWLVEVSGIPFGLMGDMLHAGGNPWRGMVYGMTVRYPWYTEGVNCDPREIWKVWDSFGIADAQMHGYWEPDRIVTTSDSNVLATVYVKEDKLLIAVASWNKQPVKVKLYINWQQLGWNTAERQMFFPAIARFQEQQTLSVADSIEMIPGKGFLIEIKK